MSCFLSCIPGKEPRTILFPIMAQFNPFICILSIFE